MKTTVSIMVLTATVTAPVSAGTRPVFRLFLVPATPRFRRGGALASPTLPGTMRADDRPGSAIVRVPA